MASRICRLCRSSSSKITNSIDDDLVIKFLDLIPKIVLSDDPSLPVGICQNCYLKAKALLDFITNIEKSQDSFPKKTIRKHCATSLPGAGSSAYDDVLQKMKKIGAISIKKISITKPNEEVELLCHEIKSEVIDDPVVYLEEVESDDVMSLSSDDGDNDSDEVESADVLTVDNSEQSGSDFEYKPKGFRKAALQKAKPIQKSQKEIYIDAPISFTCAKCKASFDDFCSLSRHMKERSCVNPADDVVECPICGKEFKNKRHLSSHINTHKPKETVMCEGCGTSFKSQYDLDLHSESVHRRVVKRDCIYRCAHCQSTFNSHLDLMEHVKQHCKLRKDEPRLCEICAKECPSLKSYKQHMERHREVQPFVCAVCKKGFTRNFLLLQHMHVHTGIKSFVCDICGRSYAKKESLRTHTRKEHSSGNNNKLRLSSKVV